MNVISRNRALFCIWVCQSIITLPDGKLVQNPVVLTILIADADDATIQHSDPNYGGLLVVLWMKR